MNSAVTTALAPGSTQLPNVRTGNIVTVGNVLDDEELWDAFTRDDREEALSRILGDDDDDNNPLGRSNMRCGSAYEMLNNMKDTLSDSDSGFVYWMYKVIDENDKPFHDEEYNDDRDGYGIPSSGGDDDKALDIGEGGRVDTRPREDDEHNGYKVSLQHVYPGSNKDTLDDLNSGFAGGTYKPKNADDEHGGQLQRDNNERFSRSLSIPTRADFMSSLDPTVTAHSTTVFPGEVPAGGLALPPESPSNDFEESPPAGQTDSTYNSNIYPQHRDNKSSYEKGREIALKPHNHEGIPLMPHENIVRVDTLPTTENMRLTSPLLRPRQDFPTSALTGLQS
ncbi:hypothetical protein EDB89DRAFT_2078872 [Lactarius sanguifluus]|nr:hypothetical protein EDB89DRAFT_2078872 [Lactarius sanguifluus]